MKKILILTIAAFALASCGNRNANKQNNTQATAKTEQAAADTHNSRNSLDYQGTYKGTIPCADCPGIQVNITIDRDGNYTKTMAYLERPNIFASEGKYTWNDSGSVITLKDGESTEMYKVGENTLTMLDQSGNAITGEFASMYILKKQ